MKFADVTFFEAHILPPICLFGIMLTIVWGAWCERKDRAATIRAAAFEEAGQALMSLSEIASRAAVRCMPGGPADEAARMRAYYYSRAAMLVRSIPAERK